MAQPECSEATLRGTYIYSYDGFAVGQGGGQQPFAFSGIESYDGAGTMTGIFSGSTNGVIDEDVFYTGTYTVNADCTSELTTVDPAEEAHYDQFIDPSGDEFRFVQTDQGVGCLRFRTAGERGDHHLQRRRPGDAIAAKV